MKKWEKWCNQLDASGQREKPESPAGIEPMTFHPQSDALITELQRTHSELGHTQGSCRTCVLYAARIGNVEIVTCVINKERW